MTTFGDLVSSIHTSLHSYTGVQEVSTYLTSEVLANEFTMSVGSSEAVLRGIAEIDDELVYVDSSDSSVLSIPPFGRGYRGSTAATHAQNTQVTFDPIFPKVEIKRAILQTVEGLFPQLYQIKSTDIAYAPQPIGFDVPADVESILEVKASTSGDPYNYWQPIYQWAFDPTSPEATGKSLNIFEYLQPGSTIRVVYRAKLGTLSANTDTLTSAGISESWADLILYGVTSRLMRFMDATRIQVSSVENLSRSAVVQGGDAGKIANQLYAMYQQRLTEERSRMLELTPARINFTR